MLWGLAVDRHLQADYPLSRLTTAAGELNRLTQKQVSHAIERIHVDLGRDEYTTPGIESVHRLRLWQADYLRLAAELDAAVHSFRLLDQGLRPQVDAALADWERRFTSARPPAEAARPPVTPGPRQLNRTRAARAGSGSSSAWAAPGSARAGPPERVMAPPAAAGQEDTRPEQEDPALDAALAEESTAPAPGPSSADITALVLGPLN